jgi:hypothetical protein
MRNGFDRSGGGERPREAQPELVEWGYTSLGVSDAATAGVGTGVRGCHHPPGQEGGLVVAHRGCRADGRSVVGSPEVERTALEAVPPEETA